MSVEASTAMKSDPVEPGPVLDPIAVIGIGCRLPGARGPRELWDLLLDGRDAVGELPPDRFSPTVRPEAIRPTLSGRIASLAGGFLNDLDRFDAAFFGISPREAERMDPQQRLLLEVAWEALEDAGQVPERLTGSDTGVFVGMWINDYEDRLFRDPEAVDFYMTTGSGRYSASGRLSYGFGWQGPSLTVDTACSSSLVAVHLACRSLWNGECGLALAGGANVILEPQVSIAYSQSKMLSPGGRCRFGDARADGYVRSDGAAVVLLKPLRRARADGDPVYAVIRGSAVNNDGRTSGFLTTPAREGQEDVLRKAYRAAGVVPGSVDYVEAHGTGTRAGDPVELLALGRVLAEGRVADRPCRVGSLKTNIGHTEGAAGVAGLIKAVLALHHRTIPASLHLVQPTEAVPWSELPLVIPSETQPWPESPGPARAGVSSFGISGTNAHVVLEEAPAGPADRPATGPGPWLLPLSARGPEALRELAAAWRDRLAESPSEFHDLVYTAAVRRGHHDHRLALLVQGPEEAKEQIEAFLRGEARPGTAISRGASAGPPRVAFVFPGQGSQWPGMGRQLLASEPVFRASLLASDRVIGEESGFSVIEELAAGAERSRLGEIDVVQPALFSIQVALAALWRSWGIEPAAVVGHSMGEVAAAHVAGVLDLADAARVICRRSRLLRRVRGRGAMAVVDLSLAEAQEAIRECQDRLSVAVSNSSRSTVLSGDPAALDSVIAGLMAREVFCRRVKVDVASHSPQMDELREDLLEALSGLQPGRGGIPLYSTVTGEVAAGPEMTAAYWVRNLREPVLFSTAVGRLVADGHLAFVEASAHPLLLPALQQELQQLGCEGAALASLRREEDERARLLESLGALYALGAAVEWKAQHPEGGRCVELPAYPWQRERFWYEPAPVRRARRDGQDGHPLLGPHLVSSADTGTHFWEAELGVDLLPWLDDHRVDGMRVVPASAYLEMALAAAAQALGAGPVLVTGVSFEQPLIVPDGAAVTVQVVVTSDRPGAASFRISSREQEGSAEATGSWIVHARGEARAEAAVEGEVPAPVPPVERTDAGVAGAAHYQAMTARRLQYGPRFQGVRQVWNGGDELIGRLEPAEDVRVEAARYRLHPAMLDAGLQLVVAAAAKAEAGSSGQETLVPVALESLRLGPATEAGPALWARACLRPASRDSRDTVLGDVVLFDDAGRLVAEARGLRLQKLARAADSEADGRFFALDWEAAPGEAAPASGPLGRWLVLAGSSPVAAELVARLRERADSVVLVSPGQAYHEHKHQHQDEPGHYRVNPERPEDFRRLIAEAGAAGPWRGVLHLWSLEVPPAEPAGAGLSALDHAQRLGCLSVLHLVQALAANPANAPRLWLVTAGAQAVAPTDEVAGLAQAPLWGFARVVAREHPELRCTAIDLSAHPDEPERRALGQELAGDGREDQVALRGADRYVARLVRRAPEDTATGPRPAARQRAAGRPFRAVAAKPGVLDDLVLRAVPRRTPGPGQVEIEVHAAGLNFMNVMSALGICPGYENGVGPLGLECAGRVIAVGPEVEGLAAGDAVVAVAYDSLASHVLADARLVAAKPSRLSFEDAATLPIAFLTAHYALVHLGRLEPGERVLIHAATGGVGLAALQIAHHVGAEVFATAGSPEKRERLHLLGAHHVMDSRSLSFADEVMEATGGEGVDLVLNSLAGEAIARSLDVLRPFGRFLEIGKRDIHRNAPLPLAPFKKSLSYFAIDLDRMIRERPGLVGALLREVLSSVDEGVFAPLARETFPVGEVAEAFRHMAQARHTGKIVFQVAGEDPLVEVEAAGPADLSTGTYLLTGGLGGLGLEMARWLAGRGARHLALVGRRGPDAAAEAALVALRAEGVEVRTLQADVADPVQVAAVIGEIARTMPPLSGVIHAAGILDDATVLHLDRPRLDAVMAPKVLGAWNLHTQTAGRRLDLFVLFSSVTSLLGLSGQSNYAAGNAFLDALAAHRRARGLPGLAINWGPWSDVGLAAARADRGSRLAERGLGSLSPEQGLADFERLLAARPVQSAVMAFDVDRWRAADPGAAGAPLLTRLVGHGTGAVAEAPAAGVREGMLAATSGRRRHAVLESHLRERVAQVLRLLPARVDVNKPLRGLGMDSLMALELRNRLEADLGLKLPATLVWNHPTVALLVPHLAGRMGIPLHEAETVAEPERETAPAPGSPEALAQVLAEIEQLTADEARRLLAEEAGGR